MVWDDDKSTASDPDNPSSDEQLTADEWDAHVTDGHFPGDEMNLGVDNGDPVLTDPQNGDQVVLRYDRSAGSWVAESLETDTLNSADLATASTDTVPVAQGDGTLAMAEAGGGLTPQGYVDEEANRSFNTTYQNTTGGPLEVFVSVVADADGDDIRSRIDMSSGSTVAIGAGPGGPRIASANQNDEITTQAFVPDGYYYEVSDIDGSISSWHEQEWS